MRLIQTWTKKRMDRHPISRRRLAPMVEAVESRLLMTGGYGAAGFLTGAVRLDGSAGAPLPGVTVEVFKAGSTAPLATQTTDANGQYLFTGLQPGNYSLKEIPPAGYQASGTNVVSQLAPASAAGLDTINVTVADPSKVFVNYGGINPASYGVVNDSVKGVATVNSVGPMRDTLGTAPGGADLSPVFQTFCVNDQQNLSFAGGESYQVIPRPISQLNDGVSTISADASGRIAYLFNHFGNSSLTNVQGAGLQLAVWELLYDGGANPDLAAGAFKVTGPYTPGDPNFAAEIQQAQTYLAGSVGKSETAVFLDAATPSPCNPDGRQSVLASESLGFTVHATPTTDCQVTNVSYVINGCTTVSELSGHVHPGDTVQAVFTVPDGQTETLSLVSYTAPQSYFDANTASQQQVYCSVTHTYTGGRHTETVSVPTGNFQVDFVCGDVIAKFGPAGSNNFYHAQGRFIDGANGGPTVCDTGHGGSVCDAGQGQGKDHDSGHGGSVCDTDHGRDKTACDTGKGHDDQDHSRRGSVCDTGHDRRDGRDDRGHGGSVCDTGGRSSGSSRDDSHKGCNS